MNPKSINLICSSFTNFKRCIHTPWLHSGLQPSYLLYNQVLVGFLYFPIHWTNASTGRLFFFFSQHICIQYLFRVYTFLYKVQNLSIILFLNLQSPTPLSLIPSLTLSRTGGIKSYSSVHTQTYKATHWPTKQSEPFLLCQFPNLNLAHSGT